jgi:hypothetical protein
MTTRKSSSRIAYPFVPEIPDRDIVNGIKDTFFVIQGEPASVTASAGSKNLYVYLFKIEQDGIYNTYTFKAVRQETTEKTEYTLTFEIEIGTGLSGIWNDPAEDSRGYLVIDGQDMYLSPFESSDPDYLLEPARTIWKDLRIPSITFISEYRHYDPTQRASLPNTVIHSFDAPDDIRIASGYNVRVRYGKDSGNLDFDGNAGNGAGLAPDNMWDTGPEWESDASGILSINGVRPDTSGDIPVISSGSVNLIPSKGTLDIQVS